eukprot:TRINITY_DN2678_c0_g1_i5.p1 TRINITY_DN2678_c0_g1~~TRINITY_DN2678_c0_g1_i5.p1  ORF type:complete len:446 (-),score=91.14 TRINITY_DN2678_c0_g1_i5:749-2086(-)
MHSGGASVVSAALPQWLSCAACVTFRGDDDAPAEAALRLADAAAALVRQRRWLAWVALPMRVLCVVCPIAQRTEVLVEMRAMCRGLQCAEDVVQQQVTPELIGAAVYFTLVVLLASEWVLVAGTLFPAELLLLSAAATVKFKNFDTLSIALCGVDLKNDSCTATFSVKTTKHRVEFVDSSAIPSARPQDYAFVRQPVLLDEGSECETAALALPHLTRVVRVSSAVADLLSASRLCSRPAWLTTETDMRRYWSAVHGIQLPAGPLSYRVAVCAGRPLTYPTCCLLATVHELPCSQPLGCVLSALGAVQLGGSPLLSFVAGVALPAPHFVSLGTTKPAPPVPQTLPDVAEKPSSHTNPSAPKPAPAKPSPSADPAPQATVAPSAKHAATSKPAPQRTKKGATDRVEQPAKEIKKKAGKAAGITRRGGRGRKKDSESGRPRKKVKPNK